MQKNNIKKITDGKSLLALLIFTAFWLISSPESALAHRATIFAWIDGDTVHTQSKLSGGKRVKGGEVIVFDPEGVVLLKGKTDDNGMFSFTIPQKTRLKIVLKASMGHQAEWSISPEEMIAPDAESITTGTTKTVSPQKANASNQVETNETSSQRSDTERCREDIQQIVDNALDRKLAPVLDKIAEAYDQGPGLTEIIGGIGYILGLVGVALIATSRRNKE
jgi:nickel transport protein